MLLARQKELSEIFHIVLWPAENSAFLLCEVFIAAVRLDRWSLESREGFLERIRRRTRQHLIYGPLSCRSYILDCILKRNLIVYG